MPEKRYWANRFQNKHGSVYKGSVKEVLISVGLRIYTEKVVLVKFMTEVVYVRAYNLPAISLFFFSRRHFRWEVSRELSKSARKVTKCG